jgi:primosomal protein N' (replication factor Y) (superfamily II helicase)
LPDTDCCMPNDCFYAEVAVALPVFNNYTYSIPPRFEAEVGVGKRVLVPFGRRRVTGYIVSLSDTVCDYETKEIIAVLDERALFPPCMLAFFKWVADYYLHPLGETIKSGLPTGLNLSDAGALSLTAQGRRLLKEKQLDRTESALLTCLAGGDCRLNQLYQKIGIVPKDLIENMLQRGLIVRKRLLTGGRTRPKMERWIKISKVASNEKPLTPTQKKTLAEVVAAGEISAAQLKAQVPGAPRVLTKLETSGHLTLFEKTVYRDPFGDFIAADIPPENTSEQAQAIATVSVALKKGFSTFLLAGVTGSGKTEVYLKLVAETIARGKTALVLVPEIALISQMERRFRARFSECVAVLHSGLSAGERLDQWQRIRDKKATVVIGARSAIFAPFDNLGLIVVDEEHDGSYKQEGGLRYNARDLAVVRAKMSGCVALLGSATPSVQSSFNVEQKKFRLVSLKKRVAQRSLPEIINVDLGLLRDNRGMDRFISPELKKAITVTLEQKKQVLLFLNRRGFANFVVCASCGAPLQCKNCAISLTKHKSVNAYKCHYCGYMRPMTTICTVCGGSQLIDLGLGTEKVAETMSVLFPKARVARMDRDTTTRRGALLELLSGLKNRTIDILVGTQMVAKGHDFPHITLVGVICADLSLGFPDFRAGERTFQLLAQVAGRAGRGDSPGQVILQTYNPKHFSIQAAQSQDFVNFYNKEIESRRALFYPPFSRLAQLKVSGRNRKLAVEVAEALGEACRSRVKRDKKLAQSVEVLGPIEAPLAKIANRFRFQILLKGRSVNLLHGLLKKLRDDNGPLFNKRQVKIAIDIDPFHML